MNQLILIFRIFLSSAAVDHLQLIR